MTNDWIFQLASLPVIGGAFLWLDRKKADKNVCIAKHDAIEKFFKDINGDVKEIKDSVNKLIDIHLNGGGR